MKNNSTKVDKAITFPLNIKTLDDAGKFDGYASTFGNKDSYNDVVVKGAFKRTITTRKGKWPILWQHNSAQPVGVNLSAEEDDKGLKVAGEINIASADGEKAYKWMKFAMDRGLDVGLSIGFRIVDKSIENGIRYLKEVALMEYSIVTFPANEEAMLTGVKSAFEEFEDKLEKAMDFNEALQQEMTERELCDLRWTIQCALSDALCSVQDDETLDTSGKLDLITKIYAQFSKSMVQWWGKWMAYMTDGEDTDAEDAAASAEEGESKAEKTKTVDGVKLTASCFAYVGDPQKTTTWKLPINFPGDVEKTKRHIRNALARFSNTDIPEVSRAGVLAKIHAAAKKHGIDVSKSYEPEFEEKVGASISDKNKKALVAAMDYHSQASDMHKAADKMHAKGIKMVSDLIGHAPQKEAPGPDIPVQDPSTQLAEDAARLAQEKKEAEEREFLSALSGLHQLVVAK